MIAAGAWWALSTVMRCSAILLVSVAAGANGIRAGKEAAALVEPANRARRGLAAQTTDDAILP
ncbi:MAG: hypothetical protein ACRDSK_03060 [Actinophytocola sp.]|uniref:hypothetical protein n=1 Tax=Actinophytocola sp. TaxID=1872138 RepID=UPI003D6BAAB7